MDEIIPRALKLRLEGVPIRQIAKQFGVPADKFHQSAKWKSAVAAAAAPQGAFAEAPKAKAPTKAKPDSNDDVFEKVVAQLTEKRDAVHRAIVAIREAQALIA